MSTRALSGARSIPAGCCGWGIVAPVGGALAAWDDGSAGLEAPGGGTADAEVIGMLVTGVADGVIELPQPVAS
jgi:hypothetical protein